MRYVGRVTHRVSFSTKERVELTWYESYLKHDICVNREIGKGQRPLIIVPIDSHCNLPQNKTRS